MLLGVGPSGQSEPIPILRLPGWHRTLLYYVSSPDSPVVIVGVANSTTALKQRAKNYTIPLCIVSSPSDLNQRRRPSGSAPRVSRNRADKFRLSWWRTSSPVMFQVSATVSTIVIASHGIKGTARFLAKGPSVSGSSLSVGNSRSIARPFAPRSIAGPTLNQQPIATARRVS